MRVANVLRDLNATLAQVTDFDIEHSAEDAALTAFHTIADRRNLKRTIRFSEGNPAVPAPLKRLTSATPPPSLRYGA
ncbi:hypothetical protein EVAR_55924_1 [Eumeta japonica]|uniref:Uncharacterized protein n=1 Tax=Eumeta variegata TaxID=151549 RepID=A0A4C1YUY2_EUMVA|nr:hypothetical protein EVAR_55924_1 [Eumeta japonica]